MRKVIVIGAGAAGLTAAIAAAQTGAAVTVLEHTENIGKKILATGNGKCNLTNTDLSLSHYHGENPEFAGEVLKQFGLKETLQFLGKLGIYTKNRKGYLYPNSEQASSVVEVLRMEAEHLKIKIKCNSQIEKISKQNTAFLVETIGWTYEADAVILAAGSKAAAATGSDGSGYSLATYLGHTLIKPLPALVQLKSKDSSFSKLAGIRADVSIKLFVDDRCEQQEIGELQLTNYGISGIPVFQISGRAAKALDRKQNTEALIDFMPDFKQDYLRRYLEQRIANGSYKTVEQLFVGFCNRKLAEVLLAKAGVQSKKPAIELTEDEWKGMLRELKEFQVVISGTNDFEQAQVCSGGIDTKEIHPESMESKLVSGLYFAGEIVDIDGDCGGYNLQWAWSSGYVAGSHAAGK